MRAIGVRDDGALLVPLSDREAVLLSPDGVWRNTIDALTHRGHWTGRNVELTSQQVKLVQEVIDGQRGR